MLVVNRRIRIPLREFRFQFARSSGAGGQNVNKVNSKATLRWPVERSSSLPDDIRQRFCTRFHRRINQKGELIISSQRFRDQGRNVADCLGKLQSLLNEIAVAPRKRTPTTPGRKAREKRLQNKRHRSARKESRRRVNRREQE